MTEWPIVRHWKCRVGVKPHRGFESPPLRLYTRTYGKSRRPQTGPSPIRCYTNGYISAIRLCEGHRPAHYPHPCSRRAPRRLSGLPTWPLNARIAGLLPIRARPKTWTISKAGRCRTSGPIQPSHALNRRVCLKESTHRVTPYCYGISANFAVKCRNTGGSSTMRSPRICWRC